MKRSESVKNIMTAIQAVQQNAGTIEKTTKGQVGSKVYNYANLNDTWDAVKGLMVQNKLVIIQSPTVGDSSMGQFFETTIYHIDSDEWISETMQMVLQRDDPQAIGAAITYYRRYMVTSMLGLIPDDDNDAKDHRLATAEQKARIIGAAKQVYPELNNAKPDVIVSTIQNMIGKYPGNVREDEAEDAVRLIQAFTAKVFEEETKDDE